MKALVIEPLAVGQEIAGKDREEIEEKRRPKSVAVQRQNLPDAVIRDQIPMSDKAWKKCLSGGLQPRDWYRLLNGKVFFWVSKKRLLRLLGAKAYRNKMHDIIEVDSTRLVEHCRENIWLCPINSGSTIMNPRPRGNGTFAKIEDYPYSEWRKKRNKVERVVELSIEYSVPDLRDFVLRVVEMKGDKEIKIVRL